MKHIKWMSRLYLPFIAFYLICGLIFALFIYLMNIFHIGDSYVSAWEHILTWGSLVLVYFVFGITSLYWYIRKIIIPMHPKNLQQQRKTLHIGGFGLYVVWFVCLIGFIVSLSIDDMTFVAFLIGLVGTLLGSILYLILGQRFLKSSGNQKSLTTSDK